MVDGQVEAMVLLEAVVESIGLSSYEPLVQVAQGAPPRKKQIVPTPEVVVTAGTGSTAVCVIQPPAC